MKLKAKLIIAATLLLTLVCVRILLTSHPGVVFGYNRFIYYPFQSSRMYLLGGLAVSFGDVLYVACGAALLVSICKIIYLAVHFRIWKLRMAGSVLNFVNAAVFVCLFFILGWGANYYKPGLRQFWRLPTRPDTAALAAFDRMLVAQLNIYAPHYHQLPFDEINRRSRQLYSQYTDSKLKINGLGVKRSLFGYFMERTGVDGYYNPFTGEGQMNDRVPAFMQPFIICHEMAHQAGIAAEDDANLLAYALGTSTDDSTFRYSSYLNIWLYAYSRLYRRDSTLAQELEARLNPLTVAHIDTLDQLSKKYRNEAARVTNQIYDNYLKIQDQKMGIRSYGNVSVTACLLETKRKNDSTTKIKIP